MSTAIQLSAANAADGIHEALKFLATAVDPLDDDIFETVCRSLVGYPDGRQLFDDFCTAARYDLGFEQWETFQNQPPASPEEIRRLADIWACAVPDADPTPEAVAAHKAAVHAKYSAEFDARCAAEDAQALRSGLLSAAPPATPLDDLPASYAPNTDLSNARRIFVRHNKTLLVIGGRFYHYTGTHWEPDETFAHRAGGELATAVRDEAAGARARFNSLVAAADFSTREKISKLQATDRRDRSRLQDVLTESAPDVVRALELAEILERWALQCEGRARQRDAVELLRSMCSFDPAKLDKEPHLLNCLSGTIDLRTGQLRPHSSSDYITKCAPVTFNPDAKAPRFEQFLDEVMAHDRSKVDFLRRWFGYAATGETREQKVIFHVGPGGGGKGTLLRAVSDVLGEYTSTAARGLITGRGGDDRHPTEIIDLRGRRLVTCHESDQSADLREGFLKQLSGEDALKGRAMRQDFVEFRPSHKLQLLSNYPPVVSGSDYGIWRRLVLIPYEVKFGSADDVASGKASQAVDPTLPEALRNEREGIFAWLVRGAAEWYRVGLQVPASIRTATDAYQGEQDRAEQFVADTFLKDPAAWISINDLHLHYKRWCVEHGYNPLGWQKLFIELRRIVGPTFVACERKSGSGKGRRTVRGCVGLRLQDDGTPFNPNSDLVGAA